MTFLRSLALVALLLSLGACLATAGGDDDGTPDAPRTPGTGKPKPEPGVCVGRGETGQACEVTADCAEPLVCVGKVCVGPNDPSHTCDAIDQVRCADEAETCVHGTCVVVPGACTTTDQCPVGFLCDAGQCKPGRDGTVCADPGPGPELTGDWAFHSTLHLRKGLPVVVDGLLRVTGVLGDLTEGTLDLGLPRELKPLQDLVNALLPTLIDQYVPEWAQQLVIALSNVSDVLDDIGVESAVRLDGALCEAAYRGTSEWKLISLRYRGQVVSVPPADIPEIGPVKPEGFGARYSCGRLYLDRHRIKNTLSGVVRWVINSTVELSTGHKTYQAALQAAIDCNGVARDINKGWNDLTKGKGGDITANVRTACQSAVQGMITEIDKVIAQAGITLSVVSLQADASVESDRRLGDGRWYGSVVGFDFPGELTGERR